MKKLAIATLCLAGLAVLLGGCSGGADDGDKATEQFKSTGPQPGLHKNTIGMGGGGGAAAPAAGAPAAPAQPPTTSSF